MSNIKNLNNKILQLLSVYLNDYSKIIKKDMIFELTKEGLDEEYAFKLLLTSVFDLDITQGEDKLLYHQYIELMIKRLDVNDYINNPYYQLIKGFNKKIGKCELKYDYYDPFEGFVFDDFIQYPNGKLLPQIGYFKKKFKYPAVYENNHLWMSITPNEINTMKKDIDDSFGKVLAYGLGLGYFPFMVSLKENVQSVTIIEKNKEIIKLFMENILPQFPNKDKIRIIEDDAFIFAQNIKNKEYDFIFVDLWHDVSDGLEMYLKMKEYEKFSIDSEFRYWIEKTIKCYL